MKFEDAVELRRLLLHRSELSEAESDALGRAEAAILSRKPASADEAVEVLDVLRENLALGQRPDGLDATATRNVRAWISGRAG